VVLSFDEPPELFGRYCPPAEVFSVDKRRNPGDVFLASWNIPKSLSSRVSSFIASRTSPPSIPTDSATPATTSTPPMLRPSTQRDSKRVLSKAYHLSGFFLWRTARRLVLPRSLLRVSRVYRVPLCRSCCLAFRRFSVLPRGTFRPFRLRRSRLSPCRYGVSGPGGRTDASLHYAEVCRTSVPVQYLTDLLAEWTDVVRIDDDPPVGCLSAL
jgi:hypothetical protein